MLTALTRLYHRLASTLFPRWYGRVYFNEPDDYE